MFSCAKLTLHFLFDKNIVFKFNYNPYSSDEPNIENINNETDGGIELSLESYNINLKNRITLENNIKELKLNIIFIIII